MTNDQIRKYLLEMKNLSGFCRDSGLAYTTLYQFRTGTHHELRRLTRDALVKAINKHSKKEPK